MKSVLAHCQNPCAGLPGASVCVCVDFSYCSLCNRDNVVVILVCSPTMFSEKKMVVGRIFLMFTAVGVMSTQDFECPFLGPWALGAQPPSRKASHLDTCGRW